QSIHESATDKIYALELMTYMTEKEQEVVKLKAYGYTYREIATQCGLSIKAVGSRFARMRRRLKQIEAV
uniref:RNA polymerase sigma factor n=2 Tax=Lachnospirales TaxID=3085636 RepID=UPI00248F7F15